MKVISRSSFNPTFMMLKFLKFEKIIKLHIGKVMYLYKNRLLEGFSDMFLLKCDAQYYNTRTKI